MMMYSVYIDEIRNHIFKLLSDYVNYDMATQ